jgi:KaiC/GvpD/RAD55 family RecA-like ATPase/predicted transcriptional regulator
MTRFIGMMEFAPDDLDDSPEGEETEKIDPGANGEAPGANLEASDTAKSDSSTKSLSNLIQPWEWFAEEEFPEVESYLDPWLQSESIIMVSGWRGVGKSLFVMTLLDALTKGGKFGEWEVMKPVPVLWYEGEMQSGLTQRRVRQSLQRPDDRKELAWILNRAQLLREGHETGLITNDEFRNRLLNKILELGIKVVALDNLSCLTSDIEENSKKEFDSVNQWLLRLRALGVTVIFVHHTGKKGEQRGTSSHEDAIDISIVLEAKGKDGAADFDVKFEKVRSIETLEDRRKIFPARRMTFQSENGEYGWSVEVESGEDLNARVLRALCARKSKATIMVETSIGRRKLDGIIRHLIAKGYLVQKETSNGKASEYSITEEGNRFIGEQCEED